MSQKPRIHHLTIIDDRQSRKRSPAVAVLAMGAMVATLMGPGVILDVPAMQWAGFVLFVSMIFLAVCKGVGKTMTIEQAREHLDDLEETTPVS